MKSSRAKSAGYLLVAGVASTLFGCATVKAPDEQANFTVKLMSLIEQPLAMFRTTWAGTEQSRLATLREQRYSLLLLERSRELDHIASVAAGDKRSADTRTKLLASVDALEAAKLSIDKRELAVATKLEGLLQPLPSTTSSVTKAQREVAQLGATLPPATRASELVAFANDVVLGVKAAKEQYDKAKAKADESAAAAEKIAFAANAATLSEAASAAVK